MHNWRRLAVAGLLAIGASPVASAQSEGRWSVEGFGALGTGAKTGDLDFDGAFGGGGGIGYQLGRRLQLRADAAAFKWEGTFTRPGGSVGVCFVLGTQRICFTGAGRAVDVTQRLKALPIFAGARHYFGTGSVRPYLELGAALAPLTLETSTSGGAATTSEQTSTKFGAIAGAGVEWRLGRTLGLGAGGRYHVLPKGVGAAADVEPSFASASVSVALRF